MGYILSKFRKRKSTKDVLDRIQKDIDGIEAFKRDTAATQKRVIGYLVTYFSALYFISALIAYFRFYRVSNNFRSQFQLLAPFLVAPLIFFMLKKVLTLWYHWKITRNEVKLERLKEQKAKILEDVMEKETYKVAKEILEKYSPESLVNANKQIATRDRSQSSAAVMTPSNGGSEDLRRRNVSNQGVGSGGGGVTSPSRASAVLNTSRVQTQQQQQPPVSRGQAGIGGQGAVRSPGNMISPGPMQRRPPGPPLPRPVMPRERGYLDRMVEYLVGDGPNNRYALICKQCQSHNGMALKEEFEYIAYRCCYCYYWNPARKQRPTAPKLPVVNQSSTESSEEEGAKPFASTPREASRERAPEKQSPPSQPIERVKEEDGAETELITAKTEEKKDEKGDEKEDEKDEEVPEKKPDE